MQDAPYSAPHYLDNGRTLALILADQLSCFNEYGVLLWKKPRHESPVLDIWGRLIAPEHKHSDEVVNTLDPKGKGMAAAGQVDREWQGATPLSDQFNNSVVPFQNEPRLEDGQKGCEVWWPHRTAESGTERWAEHMV